MVLLCLILSDFAEISGKGLMPVEGCCHVMPHKNSPVLQFHHISPGDVALLQLLEPYGMEDHNRLLAIQLCIPDEILEML